VVFSKVETIYFIHNLICSVFVRYTNSMKIEIDQSGKLENTNISTVVGFSNGKCKSIIIASREKIRLQKHFRDIDKRMIYIYFTFSAMIYLLIKSERKIEDIIIDTEYPGHEHLIKSYLIQFFTKANKKINKKRIYFRQIGHESNAHNVSITSYRSKRADIRIKAEEIIKLLA